MMKLLLFVLFYTWGEMEQADQLRPKYSNLMMKEMVNMVGAEMESSNSKMTLGIKPEWLKK